LDVIQFPPVPPGDRIVVSASAFMAFQRCPENSNARFRGEYGPPSRPSFIGGLAHRVFARHLQTGSIDDGAFDQVCREEIGSAPGLNLRMGELGIKPSQLESLVAETKMLYDRFRRFPLDGFVGAEVEIEVEPVSDVVLRGRVDAIFDDEAGTRLVDWKTGMLGGVDDQLTFYALLWALDRNELPAGVEAVSVKTGERDRATPQLADIQELAGRVAEMVTALRSAWAAGEESMERTGGPWCTYCPLLDGCTEGRAATSLLAAN
jgi:hypothetical protein